MTAQEIEERVLEIAKLLAARGPGWAQESVVMREIKETLRVHGERERAEQAVLTCWHNLFRDGKLSWGFDLANPSGPWFHVPDETGLDGIEAIGTIDALAAGR